MRPWKMLGQDWILIASQSVESSVRAIARACVLHELASLQRST